MTTSTSPRPQPSQTVRPSSSLGTEDLLHSLAEHPDFKKLVRQHASQYIHTAIKDGRLRPCRGFSQFIPRMDILDDESTSVITATFELPGVRSKEIKLEVVDGILTVSGRRNLHLQRTPGVQACLAQRSQSPNADASGSPRSTAPYRVRMACELRYGTFARTLFLPQGIKKHHINARLEHGMLILTWPRVAPPATELGTRDTTPFDDIIIHDDLKSSTVPITTTVKGEKIEHTL